MYDGIVQDLIDEFGRLPGIGPKSAQRIAFHILQTPTFDVSRLAHLLAELRERVRFCELCGNVSGESLQKGSGRCQRHDHRHERRGIHDHDARFATPHQVGVPGVERQGVCVGGRRVGREAAQLGGKRGGRMHTERRRWG